MHYQNSNLLRTLSRWALIMSSVAALIAPAAAADLPVKAPPPAPTWDGVYLGGSIGWEKSEIDWNTTCFSNLGYCGSGSFGGDGSNPHNFSMSGARYGGYFGVNWQVLPAWIVGVEVDAAWMDQSSRVTGLVGCTTFCGVPGAHTAAGDSTSVATSWDSSIRARAGYLVTPNVLLYGTAGLALKESDATASCAAGTSPWCAISTPLQARNDNGQSFVSRVQTGWTAGGGVEWRAYGNWFVRGEYRYSGYQPWSPAFFQGNITEFHATLNSNSQMAIFGVSYLFGGTPLINK
jgi:outer membrane immunogenic protein